MVFAGSDIRRIREAHRWSRRELAEQFEQTAQSLGYAVGISEKQLGRWEQADDFRPRRIQGLVLSELLRRHEEDAPASFLDAPWTIGSTFTAFEESLVTPSRLTRKGLIENASAGLAGYLLGWLTSEPQLDLATPSASASVAVVNALADHGARLRALDATHGGASLTPLAREHVEKTFRQLRLARLHRTVDRELLRVAAESAAFAGWCAFDAGHLAGADRYFDAALRAAHGSEDQTVGAYVAYCMAIRHYQRGRPSDAIAIARAALCAISGDEAPRVRVALQLVHARSLAANGDEAATYRALDRAIEAFGQGGPEPRWLYWMSEGDVHGQAGSAALQLNDDRRAAAHFAAASESYERSADRSRMLHGIRRAEALVRVGELDEACAVTQQALAAPSGHVQSQQLSRELSVLEAMIGELGSDLPVVRHTRELLRGDQRRLG